jgi:hypothetical protein
MLDHNSVLYIGSTDDAGFVHVESDLGARATFAVSTFYEKLAAHISVRIR